ncbi:ABC transporter substrate-binding protein [Bordetella pseudohinzii]|uniref:ABC transporter substrate-binding protein n=1 Tax=Bordetella pseudohinzii TaxID=1331258 RepID=A0A0J6C2K1_9BORD|nr:ABC transporter substrate-binding protein [Bordetella pseudohinzii]ANY16243.1 ABC transporter substrate-binding protein [Bordetella pseudohinzii]KMM25258.1 ABC transporter substrate-binding protein [Bordetella pseudohinzii]KXA76126.1 ABC transporter substrate-binding protein [Bordetella pseudohinzii]KXA77972.1 ABC transporter substrate-binding protein [Bordetella pseudohinzii]CUJ15106.1 Leucine-%2C isoleucine-%2C valine-%2C threonine-%2C and alanine-binding protein precursor [Bordetella pse
MKVCLGGVRLLMAAGLTALGAAAAAQDTIRIGEINSYKAQPAFLEPYKKGMQLAVDEVNAAGGIGGKPLELVIRDDNANPGDAVRAAEELFSREKVDVLTGSFLSHIGLALSDFARQKKVFFLASEPLTDKIVWQDGNRYTYRLRTSTYMQVAMLVPEALKLKKKRWAIVYPNYEYGQSAVGTFKTLMKAAQPDIEFVTEQAVPLGKVDAGSVAQALADARPDAIFNVLFATDVTKFVREGTTRGLFTNRPVVSVLTGEPEYLDTFRDETPEGWIVTGYPWQFIDTPEHQAFLKAYEAKFKDYPRLGSVVGYSAIKSLAEGMRRAGSTDTEAMIKAFAGLKLTIPFGPIEYRALDHQSTMGAYVGRLAYKDGKGIMTDFRYVDGAKVMPPDEEVRKLRRAD